MKKILIVGCGELGSRFLQAAVSLHEISEINIVEPVENARTVAIQRMNEVGRDLSTLSVNWFHEFTAQIPAGDMAVIATQADTRLLVFEKALSLGYKNFLIEKIVTQSDADYLRMLSLADKHNAKVWVNCKTRTYPVWKYIQSKISPSEKLTYHSIGGNHGICTNGLHIIDLFVYLSGASELTILNTSFDSDPHLTKRNKYDISGQLQLSNPRNSSELLLDYEKNHSQMPLEIVFTEQYRWVIDNATRQAFESSVTGDRNFKVIPFEGDVAVSVMSKAFIKGILENEQCELPSLKDCYAAHKLIFDATLPFFNEVLRKSDNICPIT